MRSSRMRQKADKATAMMRAIAAASGDTPAMLERLRGLGVDTAQPQAEVIRQANTKIAALHALQSPTLRVRILTRCAN